MQFHSLTRLGRGRGSKPRGTRPPIEKGPCHFMATLHATIVDAATNQKIDAKVHVLDCSAVGDGSVR